MVFFGKLAWRNQFASALTTLQLAEWRCLPIWQPAKIVLMVARYDPASLTNHRFCTHLLLVFAFAIAIANAIGFVRFGVLPVRLRPPSRALAATPPSLASPTSRPPAAASWRLARRLAPPALGNSLRQPRGTWTRRAATAAARATSGRRRPRCCSSGCCGRLAGYF